MLTVKNYYKLLLSTPVKLLLIIAFCFILGDFIPVDVQSFFLAMSFAIKEVLLLILPFMIFALSFYSFSQLKSNLLSFTILLLLLICISNFTAVMTCYFTAVTFKNFLYSAVKLDEVSLQLLPAFTVHLPKLIPNIYGLMSGVLLGVYASYTKNFTMLIIATKINEVVNIFLKRAFIPILPIFILGFAFKLQYEQVLVGLFNDCLALLILTVCLYFIYINLLYFFFAGCNLSSSLQMITRIMPAALVGFTTMSSAASMPVILHCATKNMKDPEIANIVVPAAINNHMIGDALGIPLIALFLYMGEYHHLPNLSTYLLFALGYILAKFTAAGVPGGTIIVMIPVFEKYLNFNSEMSGIALMLAILFDPLHTTGNIFGHGLLPIVFEKIWNKLKNNNIALINEKK